MRLFSASFSVFRGPKTETIVRAHNADNAFNRLTQLVADGKVHTTHQNENGIVRHTIRGIVEKAELCEIYREPRMVYSDAAKGFVIPTPRYNPRNDAVRRLNLPVHSSWSDGANAAHKAFGARKKMDTQADKATGAYDAPHANDKAKAAELFRQGFVWQWSRMMRKALAVKPKRSRKKVAAK